MKYLTTAQQWVRAQKRMAIAAATALAIIALAVTGGAIYNGEQNRLAAVQAAEDQAAADKEYEESRVRLAIRLQAASAAAADKFLIDAVAWAEPDDLASVTELRAALVDLDENDDPGDVIQGARRVDVAIIQAGTAEQAAERKAVAARAELGRQYIAARAAAGQSVSSEEETLIASAESYCQTFTLGYNSDMAAVAKAIAGDRANANVAAVTYFCPQFLPAVESAQFMVTEGTKRVAAEPTPIGAVGSDIAPGTYKTGSASDCYWERARGDGSTIDNDFITAALDGVSVTVNLGETFITRGCGLWIKQ